MAAIDVSRNDPCPCGSGRRYKQCHGVLNSSDVEKSSTVRNAAGVLSQAQRCHAGGDIVAARALCQQVLAENPHDPEALRLQAMCQLEQGDPELALGAMLAAVKAVSGRRSADVQKAFWEDLERVFESALSGVDADFTLATRLAYHAARSVDREPPTPHGELVSVVLVLSDAMTHLGDALASIYNQTYRDIELVVVESVQASDSSAERLAADLERCPFPWRIVPCADVSVAVKIDVGVRASTGAFVNVLHASHAFSRTRIEVLMRECAKRNAAWAFSGVEFIDDQTRSISPAADAVVADRLKLLGSIPSCDTVGFALMHRRFVAIDMGNLLFRRDLYERTQGVGDLPASICAWDFALRALWHAEPVHVPSAEYRHRMSRSATRWSAPDADLELARHDMFTGFYRCAVNDDFVPDNPFAPCSLRWRTHFLKKAFQEGHASTFGIDALERLAAKVIEQRRSWRGGTLTPGVNLIGFAFTEIGISESLRAMAKACLAGHIPFVVKDLDFLINTPQDDFNVAPYAVERLRHRCSIFCSNPDRLQWIRSLLSGANAAHGYKIGYWYWELEHLPRSWDASIVDEVWVASEFVAVAVRATTTKPVRKISPPISVSLARTYTRSEFGLPANRFLFLFSFDFNSFGKRKNPEGAIAAFRTAFPATRRDVGLVIKSINGVRQPKQLRQIGDLVAMDDRIVLIDGHLSREQLSGLQSVVDAFVSLHRSEGFGFALIEAMYLGKPVVGTRYSGNLEFMDDNNSCLVDCELVRIGRGEYAYDDERFCWANPDIGHAAYHMRRLVDDEHFRTRIARRGQHDVSERFSMSRVADLMRERLAELGLL